MSSNKSTNSDVERAMSVLTEGSDDVFVKTPLIEKILNQKSASAAEKLAEITELCKRSREDAKNASLQRTIDLQRQQLATMRTEQNLSNTRFSSHERQKGVMIRSVDAANHPMIRNSSIVRMVIVMFGFLLITEPFFIGISTDMQTMSIAFFVMTLMFGGYISLNFVETREQELLLSLADIEELKMQQREITLSYSFVAFIGALFVQLVYALYVARTAVSTFMVVVITMISCGLLFVSYGFLVTFENNYIVNDSV